MAIKEPRVVSSHRTSKNIQQPMPRAALCKLLVDDPRVTFDLVAVDPVAEDPIHHPIEMSR